MNALKALLICLSCALADVGNANPPLLKEHNQARTQTGWCGIQYFQPAPALQWNPLLAEVASKQSAAMAKANKLSHRIIARLRKRLTKAGHEYTVAAENIAFLPNSNFSVMALFLKSAVHCQNILNADYLKMGAAEINGYWTVIYTD